MCLRKRVHPSSQTRESVLYLLRESPQVTLPTQVRRTGLVPPTSLCFPVIVLQNLSSGRHSECTLSQLLSPGLIKTKGCLQVSAPIQYSVWGWEGLPLNSSQKEQVGFKPIISSRDGGHLHVREMCYVNQDTVHPNLVPWFSKRVLKQRGVYRLGMC